MDQVFAVRQVCKRYLENGKDVFWTFMDFQKVYDTIDQHGMWQMLRMYGVGGKLLKAVQNFYVELSSSHSTLPHPFDMTTPLSGVCPGGK